jgi:hypothetical protein
MTYLGIFILHLLVSIFFTIIYRRANEELPTSPSPSPESTLITIHRCQVCNKEQQHQGNTTICLQCQEDEEIGQIMENNTIPVSQYVYLRCHSISQNPFFLFISLRQ